MSLFIKHAIGILFAVGFVPSYAQLCTTPEANARESLTSRLDTTKSAGLKDDFRFWDPGQNILVRFLNGSPEQQALVLSIAREWEKYAHIKFEQVDKEPGHIRIAFGPRAENYSLLGSDANMANPAEHTMYLHKDLFNNPANLKPVVLHQFGHALGFMHEYQRPSGGVQWNKDTMYKHYALLGWENERVDRQIFDLSRLGFSNGIIYDPKSIMRNSIPAWQTTGGNAVSFNAGLSQKDKQLAANIYPNTGLSKDMVSKVQVTQFSSVNAKPDTIAGGINFYPSFNMQTSGPPCGMYFVIAIFDKDGNAVHAHNERFNFAGLVGSYKQLRPGNNAVFSINKKDPYEFALFIPGSSFSSRYKHEEVLVVFRVYAEDNHGEMHLIFSGHPVSCQMNLP